MIAGNEVTFWSTKYLFTRGILMRKGRLSRLAYRPLQIEEDCVSYVENGFTRYETIVREAHLSYEDAVRRAQAMINAKRSSLEKMMAKIDRIAAALGKTAECA